MMTVISVALTSAVFLLLSQRYHAFTFFQRHYYHRLFHSCSTRTCSLNQPHASSHPNNSSNIDPGTAKTPKTRAFIPLVGSFTTSNAYQATIGYNRQNAIIRILQFNVLADGLSGLREDLGDFGRASREILQWEYRRDRLLKEITQYNPDIITLQEVDHYHDFFWPELVSRGYVGYFAPKPTSKCIDIGGEADGCAMFVRAKRLRVISSETKTLALSKAELTDSGELQEDDKSILAQNQVALIVVCELLDDKGKLLSKAVDEEDDFDVIDEDMEARKAAPPIIVCTTHLKSAKSYIGEKYRQRGMEQVLNSTRQIYQCFSAMGRTPTVILSGDLNAVSNKVDYEALTYAKLKANPLGFRSVYNDDLLYSPARLSSSELYSTWKIRRRNNEETTIKRCIDYIFYVPYKAGSLQKNASPRGVRTKVPPTATSGEIAISLVLRFVVYFFGGLIPLTSLLSTELRAWERIEILIMSICCMVIFEYTNEGSMFKPRVAPVLLATDTLKPKSSASSPPVTLSPGFQIIEKVKIAESRFFDKLAEIGTNIQKFPEYGRPGFQPVAALDLYPDKYLEPDLIPSKDYPSDHLAIAADLELFW